MIIFDLDHTLYKTGLFKKDFHQVFSKHGLDDERFWQTFYQTYNIDSAEQGCYSIDKHLNILNEFTSEEKKQIKNELEETLAARGRDYLFSDVIPTLDKLKEMGQSMVVISKGSEECQKLKIKLLKIADYFKNIDIVQDGKIEAIRKIYKEDDQIININDHQQELSKAHEAFPKIKCIFIKRPESKDVNTGSFPMIEGLNQIFSYL